MNNIQVLIIGGTNAGKVLYISQIRRCLELPKVCSIAEGYDSIEVEVYEPYPMRIGEKEIILYKLNGLTDYEAFTALMQGYSRNKRDSL